MKLFNIFKRKSESVYLPFTTTVTPSFTDTDLDATAFACLDMICSTVASLPLDLYDRNDKSKHLEHYLHNVFKDPNADETRFQFFYNITKDYFYGNVFIYKYYNDEEDISALFRIDPKLIQVQRDSFNRKVFLYGGKTFDYKSILHIPSRWGFDGLTGKSIFKSGASTFNTTKELDTHTNNSFSNSLGKRLIIDISNAFPNATAEQIEALRTKYIANYTGSDNVGKPIVKTNRVEFSAIDSGLPDNRASQLMENREFQEKEIAKLFGVPLSFLKGENKYGDIESLYTIFLDTAIRPITTVFEESFNKLLHLNERDKMVFEYNYNALLKTSLATRIESYTKQLTHGILTVNEVRRKENNAPVDGGDNAILSGGNFFVLSQENIDAYMKNQKESNHNPLGDDKGGLI